MPASRISTPARGSKMIKAVDLLKVKTPLASNRNDAEKLLAEIVMLQSEVSKMKVQLSSLTNVEKMNADLNGKLQTVKLKHEAETAELRQEVIDLRNKNSDLVFKIQESNKVIAALNKSETQLRTFIEMSRIQLAYNFVMRYSNIDEVVTPSEIFETPTTVKKTVDDQPFVSPSQGGIKITVQKPPVRREWVNMKLKIGQVLSGMLKDEIAEGCLLETEGEDGQVTLELVTKTYVEAESTFKKINSHLREDDQQNVFGELPLENISLTAPNDKPLTPAGEELLKLKLQLYNTQNNVDAHTPRHTPEPPWEAQLRERRARDLAFQRTRTLNARPLASLATQLNVVAV